MATKKDHASTKLVLKVITGTNTDGQALTTTRTFGNVNPAISDTDLLAIGAKIGGLQAHELAKVQRTDSAELYEEE